MEEIRFVLEKLEVVNQKFDRIECPECGSQKAEEEEVEYGGGGGGREVRRRRGGGERGVRRRRGEGGGRLRVFDEEEEEVYGGGDDEEEVEYGGEEKEEEENGSGEEEEEEYGVHKEEEEYGINDGRWMPYRDNVRLPLCKAGAVEEAKKIADDVEDRNIELREEWCEMINNNVTSLPCSPLDVLPKITPACVTRWYVCYHQRYWTDVVSPTLPSHPYFRPCGMMQVFSLKLSSTQLCPVNIYGHFAVRDRWKPLRNYLFKCSKDDPATIAPGHTSLPLWIKGEDGMHLSRH